jgi:hypothetical protein
MRNLIAPVTTIVILIGCCAAQAQNAPRTCDAECMQLLQQSISDLQQRVGALEQAGKDRLATGSVDLAVVPVAPVATGSDFFAYTYIPDPPSLTPYVWALSCQHHEQTGIVPSEGGGTQQITVRRC